MVVVGAGVLVFCLYFLVVMSFVGPTSMGPTVGQNGAMQFDMTQAILSNVGQVLFLLLVTQVLQGKMLSTFKEDLQGDFHTVTRSIFVSFLAYVVLATFCLILLSLLGLMPEVTNSAVSA
jgi:predicted neutral ceramidase superfamily lipid hydrolase